MTNGSSVYVGAVRVRQMIEKRQERLDRIADKVGRGDTMSLEQMKARWENAVEDGFLRNWVFYRYMIGAQ